MYKKILALLIVALLLVPLGTALAQSYYFGLPEYTIDVYWNDDGSAAIDYLFVFANQPNGARIEYVDVGIPNGNFDVSDIFADVNGTPVFDISRGGYEGRGTGVAVGLGMHAIPPSNRGQVHVLIGRVERVLNPDTSGDNYASAVFSPTWFGSQYVTGRTDMTVTFHLPPGVQPEEPRWHEAPDGFPEEPETGIGEDGRIFYRWRNAMARPDERYLFGASFPALYVPEDTIVRSGPFDFLAGIVANFDFDCLIPLACIGFFGAITASAFFSERKRKMQYLPPKVSIEGHGIKRGLTAVEAAILMEQPVDKVLTMVLFSVIKKNATRVITRTPLRLEVPAVVPEGLNQYEIDFLNAFSKEKEPLRQRALQELMVNLIKSVSVKIKGFSRRETVAYYRDIMERAWKQVETAETPEVKSQKFDESIEWTMLDRNFNDRTRDVFRQGPVFVPTWWGRYDPGFGRTPAGRAGSETIPMGGSRPSGGQPSMPSLPGGEFAASMVTGIQDFSSRVVGNVTDFTDRVTQQTNPPPKPSSSSGRSSGGGGGGCACACACAGCACACAGGGR